MFTWDHTAAILAMLYNANRAPHTPAATPRDFHPYCPVETTNLKTLADLGLLPTQGGTPNA